MLVGVKTLAICNGWWKGGSEINKKRFDLFALKKRLKFNWQLDTHRYMGALTVPCLVIYGARRKLLPKGRL